MKKTHEDEYKVKVQPYLKRIELWKRRGANETQILKKLGISSRTWYKYRKRYPELERVIQSSMDDVILGVENTMFNQALSGHFQAEMYVLNNYGSKMTKYQNDIVKLRKKELKLKEEAVKEQRRSNDLKAEELSQINIVNNVDAEFDSI